MAEKENFYEELDRKTKRSFCTCQTLGLGFLLIAIFVVGGLVFAYTKIKTVVAPSRQVVTTGQEQTQFQQKLDDLSKAPGATTNLTLTEQELSGLLVQAISKNPSIPLRNVQAEIHADGIIVSAVATSFLNSTVQITIIPTVENEQPKLQLVKIQAGTLTVPTQLTETIAKGIEETMSSQMNELNGMIVKSVILNEGTMTITGIVKAS
jgi:hypothetical protein